MNHFFQHLNKFVSVTDQEFQEISTYFEVLSLDKKECVMLAGNHCDTNYFVLSGCLHMFFTDERGVDRTVQFAIENWWLTDAQALYHQKVTDFNIQAVENSEILVIKSDKERELLARFPKLEIYFRSIYQIAYGAALKRMQYIFSYSKEEIFFRFREEFPEFVNRVPQYLIATFLGLTPEYLSKIRAK
ncbi:Crp/Fnr family transcriptional regulator [Galbibacter sp. BG1]